MTQTIRLLKVGADYLRRGDVSCLNVLREIGCVPPDAKAFKGSFAIEFEGRSTVWWSEQDSRSFIRRLDVKYPFFPYFLLPGRRVRLIQHYLQCLLPGEVTRESGQIGMMILPRDLLRLVHRKIGTLIDYCELLHDDPRPCVRALLEGAPNPDGVVSPLLDLADDPWRLRSQLTELLPPAEHRDYWADIRGDLRYWWFKQAMDNDPFAGSVEDEVHVDAAEIRRLVMADPVSARRWFDWCWEEARTMQSHSFARVMASILLIVAGVLGDAGDPEPWDLWTDRYGQDR